MICHGPRPPAGAAELDDVARSLTRLVERPRTGPPDSLVDAVLGCAAGHVRGASWASVTTLRSRSFRTLAHTSRRARDADSLQHRLGSGPGQDAVLNGGLLVSGDVAHDPRWPECGPGSPGRSGSAASCPAAWSCWRTLS